MRIVARWLGVGQRRIGSFLEGSLIGFRTIEGIFCFACPPWFCGDTAERNPRVLDAAISDVEHCGRRDDSERIGCAVTQLDIAGPRCKPLGVRREDDCGDDLALFERASGRLRAVWQRIELIDGNLTRPIRAIDHDTRANRGQWHAEIRRVDGDARLRPSKHGMLAGLPFERITALTNLMQIAGAMGVVEIGAAGLLHQIAANRRRIAKLAGRP